MYKNMQLEENEDDEAIDAAGYTGNFRRGDDKGKKVMMTEIEFIDILVADNKLEELMKTIREIDKHHTGFVTTTELDDILRLIYPESLKDYDLKMIYKDFRSSSNKVLLNYRKLRNFL